MHIKPQKTDGKEAKERVSEDISDEVRITRNI
jgi:hypothetical protein